MEGGREGGSEGRSEGGREEERGTVLLPCPSQGLWPSCITFIDLHAIKWLVSISKLLACLLSDSWLQRMITAVGAYWVPHSHAHCMLRYCPGYPPPQQSLPRGYSAHMMEVNTSYCMLCQWCQNVGYGASVVFGPKFWCKQELVELDWVTGASLLFML